MSIIIKKAIEYRKITFIFALIIMFYGIYSYIILPRQENPQIASPTALITTILPGAGSDTVEELITKKVEDEAALLEGIEEIESISANSASLVMVTLDTRVDKEAQWSKLKVLIEDLQSELPDNTQKSVIDTDLIETVGIVVSLSSETMEYSEMENYASILRENIKGLEGIQKTELLGSPSKEIEILLDKELLNMQSISIDDVYKWIKVQSVTIPSGSIDTNLGKINVNVPSAFESITDIENIILNISEETGSVVRLKDIGSARFVYDEGKQLYRHNGKNAVLVTAFFEKDRNIVAIGDNIRTNIQNIVAQFPSEIKVDEVLFQPQDVKTAVNDFAINLLQGVIFVVLVVLIGMGIRNALVVAMSLPLTVCITFIMMNYMGIELHQISIAALIISIGILVDNSIVVSDAVQGYLQKGMEKEEAAYMGASISAVPVLTSTLTTIAAFAPLTVLPGEAGVFVKSLPQVVMMTLVNSYIVAMLVIPALTVQFFHIQKNTKEKHKLRLFFENGLNFGLKYKKVTIFTAILIFGISLSAINLMNLEIFPFVDKDIMYVNIVNQKKDGLESTKELAKQIEEELKDIKEIKDMTLSIGGAVPKFYMTVTTNPPSTDFIQIMIKYDLSESEFADKQAYAFYLQEYLEKNLLGASAEVHLLELTAPGADIDIKVEGEEVASIQRVAKEIYRELQKMESNYNVLNNISNEQYEYKVDINDDYATSFGLSKYDIQNQMNIALYGQEVTKLIKSGKEYPIILKTNINSLSDLENFKIKSSITGNKIMIKQFADIGLDKKLNIRTRLNRKPSVEVSANVKSEYSVQDVQYFIEEKVASLEGIENIKISYGGEKMVLDKYLNGLGVAALFAIVVIFLILMIQFNSFKQPFIILATVPLSIIGSIVALLIFRQSLTFTVGLGVASLIGIVVNNAILLIDFINRARKEGLELHEACIQSVEQRFRPIMLTTATTVIGLVPLLLSGSSFFSPMAIALMGGLLISTLLTLIVIPVVYTQFEK